ncbi:MAG: hypothetical protein PXZ08_12235, partial [Actinomycetota bacterium]|nr:hypothetical protein [Actinomycetota bacterium]
MDPPVPDAPGPPVLALRLIGVAAQRVRRVEAPAARRATERSAALIAPRTPGARLVARDGASPRRVADRAHERAS